MYSATLVKDREGCAWAARPPSLRTGTSCLQKSCRDGSGATVEIQPAIYDYDAERRNQVIKVLNAVHKAISVWRCFSSHRGESKSARTDTRRCVFETGILGKDRSAPDYSPINVSSYSGNRCS